MELQGVHFLYNLYDSEKVIKVYLVTFSCIYEHEKEKRLRSGFFSFLHKIKTKQNKSMLGIDFIFTQA